MRCGITLKVYVSLEVEQCPIYPNTIEVLVIFAKLSIKCNILFHLYFQNCRNWTLGYFILHVIFFIFVLVSFFTALARNMFNVSGVSAALFVVIELISIANFVLCLILVEKEMEFVRKGVLSHFTLDNVKELKQKWESYLIRRRSPGSGHSRIL